MRVELGQVRRAPSVLAAGANSGLTTCALSSRSLSVPYSMCICSGRPCYNPQPRTAVTPISRVVAWVHSILPFSVLLFLLVTHAACSHATRAHRQMRAPQSARKALSRPAAELPTRAHILLLRLVSVARGQANISRGLKRVCLPTALQVKTENGRHSVANFFMNLLF